MFLTLFSGKMQILYLSKNKIMRHERSYIMKRTAAAVKAAAAAALLMIPFLTGCGGTPKDPTADGHTDNPTQRQIMTAPPVRKERGRSFGNSYEEMLENGRVHDTDGDLTDGENSVREPW